MSGVVLVTGATGFIGGYVVRRLVDAGAHVRVLVRDPARLGPDIRFRVAPVVGDLRDPTAIERAVAGADTVLHLGAVARVWTRDRSEFARTNTLATSDIVAAARRGGVRRLVHVSTILTLPPARAAAVPPGARRLSPYEASKRRGEEIVEAYAAEGRHAVIVHPTRVMGPGPLTDANAVTRVIAMYLAGRFRVRLDDGDVLASYVHADDVAAGILLAAERGTAGAHYVLGGDNASFRQFLDVVGEVAGVRRRVVALPPAAALAAAYAAQWWATLGGMPPVTPAWIRVFLEDRRADIAPARADLGYRPRSLRTAVTETVAWLRAGAATTGAVA